MKEGKEKWHQLISIKNLSDHSKPYWNAKMSELALDIRTARPKLKLNLTTFKKAMLIDPKLKMKWKNGKQNLLD